MLFVRSVTEWPDLMVNQAAESGGLYSESGVLTMVFSAIVADAIPQSDRTPVRGGQEE